MLESQLGLSIWTLITFGVALFILWKYAFGPIQRVIDERRAAMQNSMDVAEQQLHGHYAAGTLLYDSSDLGSGDVPQPVINFRDINNGGTGHFPTGTQNFPGENPGGNTDDYATRAFGLFYAPAPGNYSLAVGADDGKRLTVADQRAALAEIRRILMPEGSGRFVISSV